MIGLADRGTSLIICSQTYNQGNFVGQNYRTEAMLASNNMATFFNKSICDGN